MRILALAANFRTEADEPMIFGYISGLDDLTIEAINVAFNAAIRTCRFMPTVAELRELAGVPKESDVAEQAADVADNARAIVGAYRSPDFQDPIINAVIRSMGGWTLFCDTPDEQWISYDRKKFVEHYRRIARSGASKDSISSLGGMHSIANSGSGKQGPNDSSVRVACHYLENLPAVGGPRLRITG